MGVTERLISEIADLNEKLAEKDAMIDYIAERMAGNMKIQGIRDGLRDPAGGHKEYWIKAAQRAVRKMPSYCEEQYIHSLEKKVKEQEAMIDWLSCQLEKREHNCKFCFDKNCTVRFADIKCGYEGPDNWKKAAQEAVRKKG